MKKKLTKWSAFLILILLTIISCSKDNNLENSNNNVQENNVQENFVGLSQVKEITKEIYFETRPNSSAGKGNTLKSSQRTLEVINEFKNEKGKISFYVINYNEGGFILLSADKRTEPILAFSKTGKFEVEESSYPPGLKFWMKDTKKQITDIQNSNIQQSKKVKLAWEQVQYSIATNSSLSEKMPPLEECDDYSETYTKGPLLRTEWNQRVGYNNALTNIYCWGVDSPVFAGCVPIAMAQVMKYHQYPTNYDWASMPLTYSSTTTENFIADIHDAIRNVYSNYPKYKCGETAVGGDMGNVLKTQFNYSSADLSNYNENTVKNSLDYNRPVILTGFNSEGGHMWVCDGYQQYSYHYADCTGGSLDPLLHMNWGWVNLSYNGYYSYNDFTPGSHNYNNDKMMIYNIIP